MSYGATGADPNGQCLFSDHKQTHLDEDHYVLQELRSMFEEQLRKSYPMRTRGNRSRVIKAPETIVILAREYERLQTDKSYGDNKDRSLWEIICHRFDSGDIKWRERAKIDSDVPDTVLNLVPERRKLQLKVSSLALYHAAAVAGIEFSISLSARGKFKITPSPSTLLRRCKDTTAAAELLKLQTSGDDKIREQRRMRMRARETVVEYKWYAIENG